MVPVMRRLVIFFLIFSFLLLDSSMQVAKAQMITTETAFELIKQEDSRVRVSAFLNRQDVQQVLVEQGVGVEEAQKRIASLSDSEVTNLAEIIEQLPAGGDQ